MTATKRKLSLTLDEELLAFLEKNPDALSAQVNDALRTEVARQQQHLALGQLLKHLDGTDGPLNSAADEEAITRYMRLLGGHA
jgi:hypothetical protein